MGIRAVPDKLSRVRVMAGFRRTRLWTTSVGFDRRGRVAVRQGVAQGCACRAVAVVEGSPHPLRRAGTK